jgi:hypothetical protein
MLPAWRKRVSGTVRSADFQVGLGRTMKTNRTTLLNASAKPVWKPALRQSAGTLPAWGDRMNGTGRNEF